MYGSAMFTRLASKPFTSPCLPPSFRFHHYPQPTPSSPPRARPLNARFLTFVSFPISAVAFPSVNYFLHLNIALNGVSVIIHHTGQCLRSYISLYLKKIVPFSQTRALDAALPLNKYTETITGVVIMAKR